jgi:uncharacterized protein (DUF1330 family)
MPAYMVIDVTVLDPDAYREYTARVPAVVARYGGRYLVRTDDVIPLAGEWRPERLIVLEFPSMERMTEWNFSPEYLALAQIRARATRTRAIAVRGVEDAARRDA